MNDFLKKLHTKNAFNKCCIDCKKNATTHALIWLGIFVCESCANMHIDHLPNGCQSNTYVKHVANEHWDDYQLRSVQLGGNKALFDLLKEFDIAELDFQKRYRHSALVWYQKRHMARMDGLEYSGLKPAKDLKERLSITKATVVNTTKTVESRSE